MQNQRYFQKNFSQPDYLVLMCLMDGPKQSTVLQAFIEQTTGLFIEPGTLYRVMTHLERRGWIERLDEIGPLHSYCITSSGIVALQSAEEVQYHRDAQRERESATLRRGKEYIMRFVVWMLQLYPLA